MERLGRPVAGPPREVRAWELACVLRAPTTAGDDFLKANVPSPAFVNQGVGMGTLAGLFGDLVPAPLAVDAERGWLVLDDFGEELGWDVPLEVVEEVARTFARLQVAAAAHGGLPLGPRGHRPPPRDRPGHLAVGGGDGRAGGRRSTPPGPVDRLVAAAGPGRARPHRDVTDGTSALCRTAQPARRRRRRLTADAPLERRGRWNWKPQGPRCRS
jgi:hypothetical protein